MEFKLKKVVKNLNGRFIQNWVLAFKHNPPNSPSQLTVTLFDIPQEQIVQIWRIETSEPYWIYEVKAWDFEHADMIADDTVCILTTVDKYRVTEIPTPYFCSMVSNFINLVKNNPKDLYIPQLLEQPKGKILYGFYTFIKPFRDGRQGISQHLFLDDYEELRYLSAFITSAEIVEDIIEHLELVTQGKLEQYCWGGDYCYIHSQKEISLVETLSENLRTHAIQPRPIDTSLLLTVMKGWRTFLIQNPKSRYTENIG
jgi:hypothetical protein